MDAYTSAKHAIHTIRTRYGGQLAAVIVFPTRVRCVLDPELREQLIEKGGALLGYYDSRAQVADLAADLRAELDG